MRTSAMGTGTGESRWPSGPAARKRRELLWSLAVAGPGFTWLFFFLLAPFAAIAVISFLSRGPHGEVGLPWTLENYARFCGFGFLGFDPLLPLIVLRSLVLGVATVALCILLGMPLAFFITSVPPRFKTVALTLVVIPLWTNLLIRTYAWQMLLAHDSWLSQAAAWIGWLAPGQALYPSAGAVYVGMVCDFLPFLVLPLYASVEKLDWNVVEAAMDLGASGWPVFRHAILPQIMPGLMAGVLLVFIPAMGQFVVPDLLGGSKWLLLGNAIQMEFGPSQDWPFGSAITVLAMVLVMAGLGSYARAVSRREEAPLL